MINLLLSRRLGKSPSPHFHSVVEPFDRVRGNLAVTPADMHEMTARGIPISPANDAMFFDGIPNPSFEVPIEYTRGVDINDIWNAQQDARKKFHNANNLDVQKYGE